ncbi:MAG: triose-phosphate isomerase [Alphaproteobacteria bacterium]
MTDRTPLIAGNWKMNLSKSEALALASDLVRWTKDHGETIEMLVCPPATLIHPVWKVIDDTPVRLGGQDCHMVDWGAHTGDISAPMLKDMMCQYVIVGHSERRANHGESSSRVACKASNAIINGLIPIICVGETEADREAGRAEEVVGQQLSESIPEGLAADQFAIAYEPVWAIGTGKTATLEDVAAMHAFIREHEEDRETADALRILYGGSVKPSNAAEIIGLTDVDGVLVGGASLKSEDFIGIAEAA